MGKLERVDFLVPESTSELGNTTLRLMMKMGWEPGQTLGKNDKGLKKPIVAKTLENQVKEGLGYKPQKVKELHVLNQIVEVLKLKIDQAQIEEMNQRTILSVFEEDSEELKRKDFKSEVKIQIFELEIEGLIDTGCDISCISEELWNELKQNKSANIPMMPIKPFQIKTAVGHKSVEIKNIVLLPLKLGNFVRETAFVIIPKLISQLILGFDWLRLNEVTINLGKNERGLILTQGGEKQLIEFCEVEKTYSEKENGVEIEIGNKVNNAEKDIVTQIHNVGVGKKNISRLLEKYKNLFSTKLGRANCYQHEIKMESQVPIIKKTYPVPYAYRDKIEEKLKEMEDQGIISRSATPYCSPLTFTLKKDGTIRVLLDAREINKFMIPETEKPPMQIDVMNSFHGSNFISIIDLNNAYFQIPISEESRKYTGFSFNGKSYIYNVLPQGLKTSVGSFSRAMDVILGHEVRDFCVNYLDDLAIITTGTLEQHIEHLDIVMGKLNKAGLTCNLEKCKFLCKEVKMLGYIISTEGLQTDPDKVKAIQDFPKPKKLKQIRAFLGLCNFYRRFIPEYSFYIQPLCELLKKNKRWQWGDNEQRAFEKVKTLFINTVQLQHPDFSKPYYLQTDSSGVGLAGVLYQLSEEGELKILGFHSKAFRGAQLNWTVTEQEFFAIISCLMKFETYLRGARVIIKTDHKALTFVKTWRLYNARVTRWVNYLENFHYEVQHVLGKENTGADILSRYLPEGDLLQEDKVNLPKILYMDLKENKDLMAKLKELPKLQREDIEIRELIERKSTIGEIEGRSQRIIDKCELLNEILYFQPEGALLKVIYLPETLREEVIRQVHLEMGHLGAYKVIKYVRDRFYWKGLTRQVKQVIRVCHDCQITKHGTLNYVGPCQSIITKEIGELVMIDLYGPLPAGKFGMNYILVLQDSFSKFVKFFELKQATTRSVLGKTKKFFEIIKPKAIMSDNGSQFSSKTWKETMEYLGVRVVYTTVRNPRPNSVERVNKELGRLFRTYCRTNHKGWVSVLPKLEELYNNTYHDSIGFTPCEVMYGKSAEISFDKLIEIEQNQKEVQEIRDLAQINLQKAGENRSTKFNQRYRLIQYQIGDFVKIKKLNRSVAKQKITKKFEPIYEGPYIIASNPYKNVYILTDPITKEVRGKFNTIHLTRYYI